MGPGGRGQVESWEGLHGTTGLASGSEEERTPQCMLVWPLAEG